MKDDRLYLVHIKECIERVKRYTEDGRDNAISIEHKLDSKGDIET